MPAAVAATLAATAGARAVATRDAATCARVPVTAAGAGTDALIGDWAVARTCPSNAMQQQQQQPDTVGAAQLRAGTQEQEARQAKQPLPAPQLQEQALQLDTAHAEVAALQLQLDSQAQASLQQQQQLVVVAEPADPGNAVSAGSPWGASSRYVPSVSSRGSAGGGSLRGAGEAGGEARAQQLHGELARAQADLAGSNAALVEARMGLEAQAQQLVRERAGLAAAAQELELRMGTLEGADALAAGLGCAALGAAADTAAAARAAQQQQAEGAARLAAETAACREGAALVGVGWLAGCGCAAPAAASMRRRQGLLCTHTHTPSCPPTPTHTHTLAGIGKGNKGGMEQVCLAGDKGKGREQRQRWCAGHQRCAAKYVVGAGLPTPGKVCMTSGVGRKVGLR